MAPLTLILDEVTALAFTLRIVNSVFVLAFRGVEGTAMALVATATHVLSVVLPVWVRALSHLLNLPC